jgi:polyferredoxin
MINTLIKSALTLVLAFLCFIPLEIWLLAMYFLQPEGFWPKFFMIGAGLWFGGVLQFGLFCLFIALLFPIWEEK